MKWIMPLVFGLLLSCGQVANTTTEQNHNDSLTAASLSSIYLFATDYASNGQLYKAILSENGTVLENSGVTLLGSSAIVRFFEGLIFILHDGFSSVSTDNIQIIDPNHYATLAQYSTGNGTNPKDVVVDGDRAFISLYNPTADLDNTDASGNPGDVIEMDLLTGSIVNRWSFWNFLTDDGDKNANADQMILADGILYICLQDLASNTFAANAPGLIGMIDTNTNQILGVITLQGRNPFNFSLSPDGTKLFIANMATFNFVLGDFDLTPPYGGIEVVNLNTRSSENFFDDEDLGGYVERTRTSNDSVLAVISEFDGASFTYHSQIIAAPLIANDANNFTSIDNQNTDIREMIVQNNYLWVSRRKINVNTGLSEPKLDVMDLETLEIIPGTLAPAAPGMSLASE